MSYSGTVRNGTIVLEPEVELPDGVKVRIDLCAEAESQALDQGAPAAPGAREPGSEEEGIWQALRSLPADASFDDLMEKLYLLYKINRGIRQLDSGQGIPHEVARERFSEWLK